MAEKPAQKEKEPEAPEESPEQFEVPDAADVPDFSGLTDDQRKVFEKLTAPFGRQDIEILPKPYKNSTDGNCKECGGYHGLPAAHLSYVGHAGVTMRLLEVDPNWSWEPLHPDIDERALAALFQSGTSSAIAEGLEWLGKHSPPRIENGGIWIRMHVAGFTAIGFGDADGKTGAPRDVKVMIGDAIRNAGMRLGIGTYLWSKSERARGELARNGVDDDEQPRQAQRSRQREQQDEDPWKVTPLTEAGKELVAQALGSDDDRTLTTLFTRARGLAPQHVIPKDLGPCAALLHIEGPFVLPAFVERVQQFVQHHQRSPLAASEGSKA